MTEVVTLSLDPTKVWLPKGYFFKEIEGTWWLTSPDGTARFMVSDLSAVDAKAFAAEMGEATGNLAYAKMQVEFTQQAMAMMLMAYVSRGSEARLGHVEEEALKMVVAQSSGEVKQVAQDQLALLEKMRG